MRVVIRIGGSIIASPINPPLISAYGDILKKLEGKGHQLVVVVGGGSVARKFIQAAKELGLKEEFQDEVAISVSRIFAYLVLKKLGKLGDKGVSLTVEQAEEGLLEGKISVMGGLKPGMTTDTVAALVCEQVDADLLVKSTDQEGVYDKDPSKYQDAVLLNRLEFEDLSLVFEEEKHKAGIHQIIDPEAVKILKRERVRVRVVNGFHPENVLSAVEGKSVGTLIE